MAVKSAPLITIAIPTYNRAATYFPQALKSALGQDYSNLEVIVSDNGSTDVTQSMVTAFRDHRLRYFRHDPGIGQRNNYNFCIDQAKGQYLLLLHDDDAIDEDFVSSCIGAAEGVSEVGVILTGVRLIDGKSAVLAQVANEAQGRELENFFRTWLAGKAPIYCCNTLFNAQKLREIGGFQSKHFCYPDTTAIFTLIARYPRIDVREAKASFRVHGGEVTYARRIAEWCEDSRDLLQLMCDLAPGSREEMFREGTRFFARANYNRAGKARSPRERLVAVLKVMSYFKYRQLPSAKLILNILDGTPVYDALRYVKRSFKPSAAAS